MVPRLLRALGLAKPQVPCWCGKLHRLGYWHDPTHGRIDRDVQEHARDLYDFQPYATKTTMGERWPAVFATEEALQRQRERGELLYWEKLEQRS